MTKISRVTNHITQYLVTHFYITNFSELSVPNQPGTEVLSQSVLIYYSHGCQSRKVYLVISSFNMAKWNCNYILLIVLDKSCPLKLILQALLNLSDYYLQVSLWI